MMHAPFVELLSEVSSEINDLSAAVVEAHPRGDPSHWNVRQIVEHLVLTYRLSGVNLQNRLEKGRATKYHPTLTQVSSKFVVLKLGYFPPGRPAPAAVTPSARPEEESNGERLAGLFSSELQAVDRILDECQEHFGGSRLATHQILGPLNVAEWRSFHVIHARHHLKQIRRLNKQNQQAMARS
jgi:hypothetical protein